MAFGILDTKYLDFPPGLDSTYIQGLQTRAGVDFPTVLRQIDSRLAAGNATVDPLVASLIYPTDQIDNQGISPTAFQVIERSEYSVARPQYLDGYATMLPIRDYEVSLQFTETGLQKMSQAKILANVDSAILGMKRNLRIASLQRLFSIAEMRVAVGTVNTSPGFAGSGTGTNAFAISTFPDGSPVGAGYTQYFRNTVANVSVVVDAALTVLQKWYPNATFEMVGNLPGINAVKGDTANFVTAGSPLIRPADNVNAALVDTAKYVGVYKGVIKVQKPLPELATTDGYLSIFVSAGDLNANNPLALRYDPLIGRAMSLYSRSLFPLDLAILTQCYGIGVNVRTAAANIRLAASGNYTDPVIS